jgi:hypothetical protein
LDNPVIPYTRVGINADVFDPIFMWVELTIPSFDLKSSVNPGFVAVPALSIHALFFDGIFPVPSIEIFVADLKFSIYLFILKNPLLEQGV